MRPRSYALRLLPVAVFWIGINSATAYAGPITFTGDPIVTALGVSGGAFLPTSPPTPIGNPPLAAEPVLVELPNFGFLEGFRVNGTLDFVATGGTAVLTYVAGAAMLPFAAAGLPAPARSRSQRTHRMRRAPGSPRSATRAPACTDRVTTTLI